MRTSVLIIISFCQRLSTEILFELLNKKKTHIDSALLFYTMVLLIEYNDTQALPTYHVIKYSMSKKF